MIIVFGAEGFIGTYLVEELVSEGFDVLAVGLDKLGEAYYRRRKIPFARVDITKERQLRRLPAKAGSSVVNLACLQPANVSEEQYKPTDYIRVNVLGTLNVLEFCRRAGIRKIICAISHRSVQGLWERGRIITEDEMKAIKYTGEYAMYSISESAALDCMLHYSELYAMQAIVFRLPPVYGYGPHTEGFKNGKPQKTGFQVFIENATKGEPIELWGDHEKARDIIYVKDVVSAIVLALRSTKAHGLYNIASGRQLSLKEEAEGIIRAFSPEDHPSRIAYRPNKPNSIEPFLYDISKAKRDLGWSPKYSFADMLDDYQREMKCGRFSFLVEKRQRMIGSRRERGIGRLQNHYKRNIDGE
jgi:UDP-glucose 4-epimerase